MVLLLALHAQRVDINSMVVVPGSAPDEVSAAAGLGDTAASTSRRLSSTIMELVLALHAHLARNESRVAVREGVFVPLRAASRSTSRNT